MKRSSKRRPLNWQVQIRLKIIVSTYYEIDFKVDWVHLEIACYRVSVQGVESLWGDCRFIPADTGYLMLKRQK